MMHLFNTLERKRERNFAIICKTFEEKGIRTTEEAQRCRSTMLSNAKVYTAFIAMVGLSLAMLFPAVATLILLGMGLLLVYIWTSTYRGRELVLRYIDEVIEATPSEDDQEQPNT